MRLKDRMFESIRTSAGRARADVEPAKPVDMSVKVATAVLDNPMMPAAGTYGLGMEAAPFGSLERLGCFVTKSVSAAPWKGNSGGNLAPWSGGNMLNSVGLKNPGIVDWLESYYPGLEQAGVKVVVSLWGNCAEDIFEAASHLVGRAAVIAVEVNLSCPNHRDPRFLVSHDSSESGRYVEAAVDALGNAPIDVWAKLAPTTPDLVAVAERVAASGAGAVTLVNTMSGMVVNLEERRAVLSGTYGGLSGPSLHPIALRAVHQVHSVVPELSILGVGGVVDAESALGMIAVGASAVQVGTASFADPRATGKILRGMQQWCSEHGTTPAEVRGTIRGNAFSSVD